MNAPSSSPSSPPNCLLTGCSGLEAIRSCSHVFLEAYTSILGVDKERLEAFYEKEVKVADRDLVEQGSDEILVRVCACVCHCE